MTRGVLIGLFVSLTIHLYATSILVPMDDAHVLEGDAELRKRHERSRMYREDPPRLKARSTNCAFPWSYSRDSHRCVCVRTGYSVQQGACAPDGASASCGDRERWAPETAACIHESDGVCAMICSSNFTRSGLLVSPSVNAN